MENKTRDIVVVFLSCRWEDTETYCLQKLAALTDDHYVMPYDFAAYDIDPLEILDDVEKKKPGAKLLVLVNNNKSVTRYNHMYRLHFKFEEFCKAGIPILLTIQEEALCPKHDTISPAMQTKCDEYIRGVENILKNYNPTAFKKHFTYKEIFN